MENFFRESGVKWLWERIKTLLSAKQDKLVSGTNIKTINGTSLLGIGDISIEGGDSTGDVDEGRLVWSEEAVSKGTIIDNIMYNAHQNGLAFMNPSCIDVYYSTDNGDTWQDYGLTTVQKVYLVTPVTGNCNLYLGKDSTNKSVNYRLRVDLRIKDADIQFTGKKLYLKWFSNTSSDAYYIDISVLKYENYESNEWTHVGTFHKKNTLTIPLNEEVGYNGAGGILSLRIEAYRTGTTEPRYNSALTNIAFLYTVYTKGNSFGKTGLPMTIDTSQTAIFPAYIKAQKFITNGGKSTQVVKGDGSLEEESALAVASAIDAEHAEEADYAGVADKADKLTNARTIALSEGVVSAATSFDGSKNISIPVRELSDLHLKRTYNSNGRADFLSLADLASPLFASNRLAFNNPDGILIYKSNDGGATWGDYGATDEQKTKFTTGINQPIYIGGKTTGQISVQDRLRIVLTSNRNAYTSIEEFLFYITTSGAESCQCRLSYVTAAQFDATLNYNSQAYTEITTKQVVGWSGWNRLLQTYSNAFGYDSANNVKAFMFEFWFERARSGYEDKVGFYLSQLVGIGKNVYSNNTKSEMMNNGHLYSYDWQKNVTFPANITAAKHVTSGGTNQQVVLGNGSLKSLDELSPITDADADILLDNHIHSIDVNANGNNVNISIIESSKNGDTWETEDNDIPIPLATTTSAGLMSKEDKIKSDGLLIYYHLTEDEYNNHEIVSLYPLVLAIKDALFDSSTNKWKYDDSKTYDVRVKGWTLQDNGITYANFNVRLLTTRDGHSLGINGYVDVAQITETNEDADYPLYVGYICGKYAIEDDGMIFCAPENTDFYVEV